MKFNKLLLTLTIICSLNSIFCMTPEEQLFKAAASGDVSKTHEILVNNPNINLDWKHDKWGGRTILCELAAIRDVPGLGCIDDLLFYLNEGINPADLDLIKLRRILIDNYKIIIKMLISHGVNINIPIDIQTPLHKAASNGFLNENNIPEILLFLLDNGGDINAADNKGNTVLHNAVMHACRPEILSVLLQRGANVNAKNNSGNTPLHQACKFNFFSRKKAQLLLALLAHNADSSIKNNKDKTAKEVAKTEEIKDIINSSVQVIKR